MPKSRKHETRYTSFNIEIKNSDILDEVRDLARNEFEERRSCARNEVDQWVKTICELQRKSKVLQTQVDRLESIVKDLQKQANL